MTEYLKCDAHGCDHVEVVGQITVDMIGRPCPKCGANLLTAEDWAGWSAAVRPSMDMLAEAGLLDLDVDSRSTGQLVRVGLHAGQLTMSSGKLATPDELADSELSPEDLANKYGFGDDR